MAAYERELTQMRNALRSEMHRHEIRDDERRDERKDDEEDEDDEDDEDDVVATAAAAYLPAHLRHDAEKREPNDGDSENKENHHGDDRPVHDSSSLSLRRAELERSIAAKEELAARLRSARDEYESMRVFYEKKLESAERLLEQRETEREALRQRLAAAATDPDDARRQLDAKDRHIAHLKKQRTNLARLARVSSGNDAAAERLERELVELRRQKADLARRAAAERREHADEVRRLAKDLRQEERAANRWRTKSRAHEAAAENAKRVAKSRSTEIVRLRERYRDAERELRVRTVAKGALRRAGVDATMVGRPRRETGRERTDDPGTKDRLPVDAVRRFLSDRVSRVGRMEIVAEKVAAEWEEHLSLTERRETLSADDDDNHGDERDALDAQIAYKETRIRELTNKLGRQSTAMKNRMTKAGEGVNVLQDKQFRTLSQGLPDLASAQETCQILFGMVVRERRRVSSLARTACNLDTKAREMHKTNETRETAFKAHVEEEREERADLAHRHREQILTLMDLVKRTDVEGRGSNDNVHHLEGILTGYNVNALEAELRELRGASEENRTFLVRQEELETELQERRTECRKLQRELQHYRQQFRRKVEGSRATGGGGGVIGPSPAASPRARRTTTSASSGSNPYVKRHRRVARSNSGGGSARSSPTKLVATPSPKRKSLRVLLDDADDDDGDEEEEEPEWAADIMADLALIAEGEMPPSIAESNNNSVFDRLSNPHNFTGVQKQRRRCDDANHATTTDQQQSSPERANAARSSSLSQEPSPEKDTVYDRLFDPSKFTGTQKAIFDRRGKPRRRSSSNDEPPPPRRCADEDGRGRQSHPPRHRSSTTSTDETTLRTTPPREDEGRGRATSSPRERSSASETTPSVYDRLLDPSNFTGVQKTVAWRNKSRGRGTT